MAHDIATMMDGRNAIAYVGKLPWHGLGQELTQNADIETWRIEAGLNFDVKAAKVQYMNGNLHTMPDRNVLYRSDNNAPLSVVSNKYRVVQPSQVLDFFKTLTNTAGFQLESAGVLAGGRKVWAMARVNEGAEIVDHDVVRPYVLLATSFDATLSTTAKFTTVRVVCANTLAMATENGEKEVRVSHNDRFDADKVRQELGIVTSAWDRFIITSRKLADTQLSLAIAQDLTTELILPTLSVPKGMTEPDVRTSRPYLRIMDLFTGKSKGYDLVGDSAWGWVNAVTEMVDHERGRSDSTRMDSAWFGSGNTLKDRAVELALTA